MDFTHSSTLYPALLYNGRYLTYGFAARLLFRRYRRGNDNVRPTIRRRTPRRSSRLRSRQRHHRRQCVGPAVLMAPKSLKKVYFDPKRVGSYGGVDALRRVTHAPRKIVAQWLSEQDAYSLHKPARRRFKRRCVIVGGMNQQWQAGRHLLRTGAAESVGTGR